LDEKEARRTTAAPPERAVAKLVRIAARSRTWASAAPHLRPQRVWILKNSATVFRRAAAIDAANAISRAPTRRELHGVVLERDGRVEMVTAVKSFTTSRSGPPFWLTALKQMFYTFV